MTEFLIVLFPVGATFAWIVWDAKRSVGRRRDS